MTSDSLRLPPSRLPRPSRADWLPAVVRNSSRFALPQVVGVIVLYVLGSILIDGYASLSSIRSMLVIASFLGVAAAGQTFAVLLAGIDLSIPSLMALGDVMAAQLTGNGWPFWAVTLLIIAISACIGAINGIVAKRFEIHPLIVTLGMGSVVAGGLLIWTKGQATGSAPSWLSTFVSPIAHTGPLPVPPVVSLWIVISLLIIAGLTRTTVGRKLYAAASSDVAARLDHIRTNLVWLAAFLISAVLAAVSGILLAGFSSTGDLSIGSPYLFSTIAAVVVGGTSLLGARGGYGRVAIGALMLTEIQTILVGKGLSDAAQQAVLGLIILAVVAVYGRERPLGERV
jgi:ribose transport system permease protein